MSRPLITLTALCCVAASMSAADRAGLDVRLSAGIAPGITEWESTSLSDDSGITVEPGLFYSHPLGGGFGLVAGGSLFYRTAEGKTSISGSYVAGTTTSENLKLSLDGYGVDVAFGPYWAKDGWRIELTPVIGVGLAKTTVDYNATTTLDSSGAVVNVQSGSDSKQGLYYDYGIRLGGSYAVSDSVLIGAQVGYLAFKAADADGDTVKGDGLVATAMIGYSF